MAAGKRNEKEDVGENYKEGKGNGKHFVLLGLC